MSSDEYYFEAFVGHQFQGDVEGVGNDMEVVELMEVFGNLHGCCTTIEHDIVALFDEFGGFDADALFLPEVKHPFLDNCSFFVRVFDRSAHGSTACTDEEFAVLQDGQILTNGNFRNTGFFAQFRNQDLLFCIELF